MIKDRRPLSMAEVKETLKSVKETEKNADIKTFINKFSDISFEKAEKIKQELEGLDIAKLNSSDICKIIDLLPEDATELNKIFVEVTLDADETNKILETIKNNK